MERSIKEMQTRSKIRREKAIHSLSGGDESLRSNLISYPTHFIHIISGEKKKKFNPLSIEKCFSQGFGNKPLSIRTNIDSGFVIDI